jgi:HlyD family secretion protein
MDAELKNLQIDRSKRRQEASPWATRWILAGVTLFVLLGATRFIYGKLNEATEVDTVRVQAPVTGSGGEGNIILNATGYIIAAHRIELASKVVGKVSWIGVEKGDHVRQDQVLVRLEDDEYQAQLLQAKGQLENLKAKLEQSVNGSRPEEIAKAKADLEQGRADQQNARVTLTRTKDLTDQGVLSKQALDDAQAKYDSAAAKVQSLDRALELVRLGPRKEETDALRAQVRQMEGLLAYAQTQEDNTVIKAPINGTILERNVEKGEFVTTGFVGDKGAKGYVVSMANLSDLQVELDINQSDFAKLGPKQPGMITTDAYGNDKKWHGFIEEVSPEANRQKATVQVKVRVQNPNELLRPDMNATVAFYSPEKPGATSGSSQAAPVKAVVTIPPAAIRDGSVFIAVNGKAIKRTVKVGSTGVGGVQVEDGLIGGEDVVLNAPADLKDGQKIRSKKG